jgi:hypothetical protein
MVVYLPAEVNIRNRYRMFQGQGILLKPDDLSGSHVIHLTKRQHTKLMKHRGTKKGMKLKLSPEHITYLEGTGFFNDLKNKMKQVYQKVKPYIRPGLHKGLDFASDILKPIAIAEMGPLGNEAVNVGTKLAHYGVDRLGDTTNGYGVGATQETLANFNIRSKNMNAKSKKGGSFLPSGM